MTPSSPLSSDAVHLVFDADDTLWENNIYFEQAIAEFVSLLDHSTLSPAEVRAVLDQIEHTTIGVHGYGAESFARSLSGTFRDLAEGDVSDEDVARVRALGRRILEQDMQLLPGVNATLAELATRHSLAIVTKGHHDEQELKVERSGIARYFTHVDIVPEKNTDTYLRLTRAHGWTPESTWMIGNSPKSDINPALAAGLNAVFIPHPATWSFEAQDVQEPADPSRLRRLPRFADLVTIF